MWISELTLKIKKKTNLIVFDGQIASVLFQMRSLHEETSGDALSDVDIKLLVFEVGADQFEIKPLHSSLELHTDVLSLLQGTMRKKELIAPTGIHVCGGHLD
jgi:hypothetical protein